MKDGRFENMDERVEYRTINPPMSVRVRPRILATLHRWLEETVVVRSKSDIVSKTLDAVMDSLLDQGVVPFIDDMEAMRYLAGKGLALDTSNRGKAALRSLKRYSSRNEVRNEIGMTQDDIEQFKQEIERQHEPTTVTNSGTYDNEAMKQQIEEMKQKASGMFRNEEDM